jgi:hypothetical protein
MTDIDMSRFDSLVMGKVASLVPIRNMVIEGATSYETLLKIIRTRLIFYKNEGIKSKYKYIAYKNVLLRTKILFGEYISEIDVFFPLASKNPANNHWSMYDNVMTTAKFESGDWSDADLEAMVNIYRDVKVIEPRTISVERFLGNDTTPFPSRDLVNEHIGNMFINIKDASRFISKCLKMLAEMGYWNYGTRNFSGGSKLPSTYSIGPTKTSLLIYKSFLISFDINGKIKGMEVEDNNVVYNVTNNVYMFSNTQVAVPSNDATCSRAVDLLRSLESYGMDSKSIRAL